MVEAILTLDRSLFELINGAHTLWLDDAMGLISEKWAWIPAYVVLLASLLYKFGWKKTLVIVGFVIPLIVLSDQLSASLLKPWIARLRPCNEAAWFHGKVHLPTGHCGGAFGFVSSHAANFFALATYLSVVFWEHKWHWKFMFFMCAGVVGYSRIYLGVHYPGDVLGGALLGILVGLAIGWGYINLLERLKEKKITFI